jgi:hypothetical protein
MRQREREEFYQAVLALRRAGYHVERANPAGVRFGRGPARKYIANEELMRRAEYYLHQLVQLELFPGLGS